VSSSDWYFLAGISGSIFANGGHRTYLPLAYAAVGASANDVAAMTIASQAYYELTANTYAALLQIAGGSLGVGNAGLDLPLVGTLGSAAFADIEQIVARRPVVQDLNYQITPQDFWNALLLTTSGIRTYTLPLWADMPALVPALLGKNRSGSSLTINRAGTDTMDAAASSVAVPTGSSYEIYKGDAAGTWETRIFA
jgi:hypothetical protein